MKTTVVYHSADFDGLFCREIARKFLSDAELIGWDFGDKPHPGDKDPLHKFYILDLPVDRVFGFDFSKSDTAAVNSANYRNIVWIDHHASSIETHPTNIPGYRIDGVAACRLAWQWFTVYGGYPDGDPTLDHTFPLPNKQTFIGRNVLEPLAVRLAGEYDVFDKRDPRAELFQHGLRAQDITPEIWEMILGNVTENSITVDALLERGTVLQFARAQEYRDVITSQGFAVDFDGLKFLACCSHEVDIRSHLFEAGIKPEHDALFGFTYTGKGWRVSLYRIPGKDADILSIAKKYGGGGHLGACGFMVNRLPFLP